MTPEALSPQQPEVFAPRLTQLLDFFEMVLSERMGGIPVVNPSLCVEPVGFEHSDSLAAELADMTEPTDDLLASYNGSILEGVLITPWFMSLVRLPVTTMAGQRYTGKRYLRQFGGEAFDFLGNYDATVGYFESCALFSPMAGFDNQSLARETARHVLEQLRQEVRSRPPTSSRRLFLTGRRPNSGAPS